MPAITNAQFAEGYLLYSKEGVLQAQPFDAKLGKVQGDAGAVTTESQRRWVKLAGPLVWRNGQVAYSGGAQTQTQLAWFDRTGKRFTGVCMEKSFQAWLACIGPHRAIRLSPRADQRGSGDPRQCDRRVGHGSLTGNAHTTDVWSGGQ